MPLGRPSEGQHKSSLLRYLPAALLALLVSGDATKERLAQALQSAGDPEGKLVAQVPQKPATQRSIDESCDGGNQRTTENDGPRANTVLDVVDSGQEFLGPQNQISGMYVPPIENDGVANQGSRPGNAVDLELEASAESSQRSPSMSPRDIEKLKADIAVMEALLAPDAHERWTNFLEHTKGELSLREFDQVLDILVALRKREETRRSSEEAVAPAMQDIDGPEPQKPARVDPKKSMPIEGKKLPSVLPKGPADDTKIIDHERRGGGANQDRKEDSTTSRRSSGRGGYQHAQVWGPSTAPSTMWLSGSPENHIEKLPNQ